MKDRRCDEELSALLDGELQAEERERLMEKLRAEPALRQRLAQLRQAQKMYRMAFEAEPQAGRSARSRLPYAAAAVLLVCLGVALGLALQSPTTQPFAPLRVQAGQIAEAPAGDTVLHVSQGDEKSMRAALDRLEVLLREREEKVQGHRLELVVNGDALRLLRADVSPHKERIRALLARYDKLTFIACRQTLMRMQAQGEVPLLPGVEVADSGLDQILRRLREGWTYVKI